MTDDDRVFKALADPTRRLLLDRLFERDGRTLMELEAELAMTRFGVMKHLRVLEHAGLVVTRRSGRKKLHVLNPVPIRRIHDRWIDKYTGPGAAAPTGLKKTLEGPWRIELLAGLRAQRSDQVLTGLATRKTDVLLAYLAYYLPRLHSREELIELLWPRCAPQSARQSLRQTLLVLRRQLEPPGVAAGSVLVAERDTVRLDTAAVRTDVAEFQAAVGAAVSGNSDALTHAVELYRGDLLPGLSEEWVLRERQWLQDQYFQALHPLLLHLEQAGDLHRAILLAQRGVQIDPLREAACRDLMRLSAAAGQPSTALRHYRELERRLREQFDARPDPATTVLARAIERGSGVQAMANGQWLMVDGDRPSSTINHQPSTIDHRLNTRTPEHLSPEGENRLVTVLSATVRPSDPARSDPTRMEGVVDRLRPAMAETLRKYGGRWDSGRRGAVRIVFGVPRAHERDPERAIRAALEIQDAAAGLDLWIGVGIETGQAYVGAGGPEGEQRVTSASRVVTDAVRLAGHAEPGEILVGETTYRLTQRAFDFIPRPLPGREARRGHGGANGHAGRIYAVTRLLSRMENASIMEGRRAELLGRDEELAKLTSALAAMLQPTAHGSSGGQIVCLFGEAGVGKSRLVAELKAACGGSVKSEVLSLKDSTLNTDSSTLNTQHLTLNPLWLEGHCLEWAMTAGYSVFIDLFRDLLAGCSQEDDAASGAPLAAVLRQLVTTQALPAARVEEIGPLLGNLLSLRFGNGWDLRLKHAGPEQIRHQTFLAVRDFFVALARRQPVILVLEDLHWADSLSLELISLLMETLAHAPLFLLCVYRPEREHRCRHLATLAEQKSGKRCTVLHLRELTPAHSRRLVEALLPGSGRDAPVRDRVLEKARGNPFFIEEVARALIEAGAAGGQADSRPSPVGQAVSLPSSVVLPESIQSLIRSRVDRLDPSLKGVLEHASVIGHRFRHRLLESVLTGHALNPLSLTAALGELEERGLIYPERVVPEAEYTFRHVLLQEAIYQSLPQRRQAALHQQVAEVLEALSAEQPDEYYEQLAYHYERAAVDEKAVEYLLKAGAKAQCAHANEAALSYFRRALDRLDEGDFGFWNDPRGESEPPNPQSAIVSGWRVEALTRQGQVYLGIGQVAEAEECFRAAIAVGQESGGALRARVRLYYWLAQTLFLQNRYEEMLRLGEEGLGLLGAATGSVEAALMNASIAMAHESRGDVPQYLALHHRNAQFLEHLPYSEELGAVYSDLVEAYLYGDRDGEEAARWAQVLQQKAEQHDDLRALATARFLQGETAFNRGDGRAGARHLQQALGLYRRIGLAAQEAACLRTAGWLFLSLGEIEKLREHAEQARVLEEALGNKRDTASAWLQIGVASLCEGSLEAAAAACRQAIELLREIGHPWENRAVFFLGRVCLAQGRRSEAQQQFRKAVTLAQSQETPLLDAWSSLEAVCEDPEQFRAFCRRFREAHAEALDPFFVQWFLEPAQPDCGFRFLDSDASQDGQDKDGQDNGGQDGKGRNATSGRSWSGSSLSCPPLSCPSLSCPSCEASDGEIRNPKSEIPGWSFVDPLGDCACTVGEGLEIRAANQRDLRRPNLSAPRLVRPVAGEFALEAGCCPADARRPALGGLLIWKDAGNFLRLDRGTRGETEISFAGCIAGHDHLIGRGHLPPSERVFLRLERRAGRVRALCSADGQRWFTVGEAPFAPEDPVEVGVHAIGVIERYFYPGAHPEGTAIRFETLHLCQPAPTRGRA